MKYVFLLLIGIISVATLSPLVALEKVNQEKATTSSIAAPEVKAESVKETVKDAQKKPEPKPVNVVKDNPKDCDRATEWIYPDGSCHKKAGGASPSSSTSNSGRLVGSGSCEAAIRSIFPASQHSTAIRVMLQESSGDPANHNYNPATKDNSYGCFQVNIWGENARTRPPASELVKADVNVRYAYNLWQSTGWCSSGGWLNTSIKLGIC